MYNDLVKELLEKHYGAPKRSLTIDETDRDRGLYYYSFEEEKTIVSIRDLLDLKKPGKDDENIAVLKQSVPFKDDKTSDVPHCVCFKESNGNWTAYFHKITGVHYFWTRENKAVAELLIDDYPFVMLSDCYGDFYGFWRKMQTKKRAPYNDRDGFSYWMNKALKTNERFRKFAADFFLSVAESERLYILKDVARAISNCGCFLPPVSFQDLLTFRTPVELIRSLQTEHTDISVDFNKVDLNVGYIMAMLAPEVDKRDWKLICKFDAKTVSETVSLKLFYDGFTAEEFVKRYYRKTLAKAASESCIRTYVEDYVGMCLEAGDKLRIGYSPDALVRAHDELSIRNRVKADKEEFDKPLVAAPSKFDKLEASIKEAGLSDFERIRTTERLLREGEYQHNCVFSRKGLVRRDRASIYHWDHKGESYTVQFKRDRKGRYFIDEVRARFNRSITDEHLRDLKQMLSGICFFDDGSVLRFPQYEFAADHFTRWQEIDFEDDQFAADLPF